MTARPTRRRFLRIAAASTLAPLIGPAALTGGEPVATWRGLTMGTLTRIDICDRDPARAARILDAATQEIARLERIFTLYRGDTALAQLNRDGRLADPPFDLVRLLAEACGFSERTRGAFDVTVQPLWQAYAAHFSVPGADPAGPTADIVRRAVDHVGYAGLEVEPAEIRLARAGMAVTLNGIAPGYMTDRIVELLKNEGLDHALVDLGEIRAMGARADGEPWRAAIRDPIRPGGRVMELTLADQALATSGGYGFRFDPQGRCHHIFDPRTGRCPQSYASVSVLAPTATVADALATAICLMPRDAIAATLRACGAVRAVIVLPDGETRSIEA